VLAADRIFEHVFIVPFMIRISLMRIASVLQICLR
jgi:hypothetical protein